MDKSFTERNLILSEGNLEIAKKHNTFELERTNHGYNYMYNCPNCHKI